MPTNKNKVRDLKPTKDAKGGGGRHLVQGGQQVDGGRGVTQGGGATDGPVLKGKVENPIATEGAHGNR